MLRPRPQADEGIAAHGRSRGRTAGGPTRVGLAHRGAQQSPASSDALRMAQTLDLTALQILCDALQDGVLFFDTSRRVAMANAAAYRLLSASPGSLSGLSAHEVALSHAHVPREMMPRLRAGESVAATGPDGTPDRFFVQLVTLPGGRPGEWLSAMVVRDRTLARALRRTEDALRTAPPLRARTADAVGRSPVQVAGPRGFLRDLADEIRRSTRDGEPLGVMVVQVLAGLEQPGLESILSHTLRRGDRAGVVRMESGPLRDPDARALVQLAPSGAGGPEAGELLAFLILPGTTSAGLSAALLRLRTEFVANHATVGCGGATLRSFALADGPDREDGPALLARAWRACLRESREVARPAAANEAPAQRDVEITSVGAGEGIAA
ncbi:MAG: hypothetical protein B7733_12255 [Myxococcales bacterium FL481]|nr:MAG: hypothetical protein B7733_12255 [Myxococcales bacterium FL481]